MTCCIIGAFENRSPETSLKRQRATGVGTSFQSSGACWQTARNRGRSAAFRRYLRGLDWLNFFLAELQTGVGPFLAIYLAGNGWNEERAGVALTIGGIAGIIAQTPVGALVDQVRRKRTLIATGIGALALGALLITFVPTFWSVMAAQVLIGGTSSIFGPAICAISLGIVGHHWFDARQGRNQSFNSAGNVVAAVSMGLLGYFVSKGSGRFNITLGAIGTAVGILYFFMPETREKSFLNENL